MSPAAFGLVLARMANYAVERAECRKHYLGPENHELLWAISHMLMTGSQCCLEQAEESKIEDAA